MTDSSPLIVLGIDSFDFEIFKAMEGDLPTLSALAQQGFATSFDSTIPPDSPTAWATIYTGLNPGEHGVLEFLDPVAKHVRIHTRELPNEAVRGLTFWDEAGRAGLRVAVVLAPFAYPAWTTTGIMIGRSRTSARFSVVPGSAATLVDETANPPLGLPGRGRPLSTFVRKLEEMMRAEFDLATRVLKRQSWDLLFAYSSALDAVQHFLWEPEPQGGTPSSVRDFYILLDSLIKRLVEDAPSDAHVLIVSDHGHGPRPSVLFHINSYLARRSLIALRGSSLGVSAVPFGVRIRRSLSVATTRYDLGRVAQRLLVTFPWIRDWFVRPGFIDWQATAAVGVDTSGFKGYEYGGIRINADAVPASGRAYDGLREELTAMLMRDLPREIGEPVFEWVRKREEIYDGGHVGQAPDLIYKTRAGVGTSGQLSERLITRVSGGSLVPGTHRVGGATLISSDPASFTGVDPDELAIGQVHDLILTLLGLNT